MNMSPVLDRLPLLLDTNSVSTVTGDRRMITGMAKAITPFGPLAGLTTITVDPDGPDDLAVIRFMCGDTPVSLAVADGHLNALIQALLAAQSASSRDRSESQLHAVTQLHQAVAA